MLTPRDAGYLLDILNAARGACHYVSGLTFESFSSDVQCQDAVVRRIEIMGEAARRISMEARSELKDIPLEQMVGIRNVMIHDYDDVDLNIVWDTVMKDLPPVIDRLLSIVPPQKSE